MSADQTWTYPEDVSHSIELPGVYDGVCIWVLNDGRLINRFEDSPGRRRDAVAQVIASMTENLTTTPDHPKAMNTRAEEQA